MTAAQVSQGLEKMGMDMRRWKDTDEELKDQAKRIGLRGDLKVHDFSCISKACTNLHSLR